jgi:hypothetical protein
MGPYLSRDPALHPFSNSWHSAALRRQGWVKISPIRVFPFDQIDFPVTLPLLDLPFPDQRCLKAFMGFEPHETVDAVLGGKAGDRSCLVLPNAAREFEARTDVERAVGPAGKEINKRHRADRNMGSCLRRNPRFAATLDHKGRLIDSLV